jgi:hypothetical protein
MCLMRPSASAPPWARVDPPRVAQFKSNFLAAFRAGAVGFDPIAFPPIRILHLTTPPTSPRHFTDCKDIILDAIAHLLDGSGFPSLSPAVRRKLELIGKSIECKKLNAAKTVSLTQIQVNRLLQQQIFALNHQTCRNDINRRNQNRTLTSRSLLLSMPLRRLVPLDAIICSTSCISSLSATLRPIRSPT